jgi:hypothetical protein
MAGSCLRDCNFSRKSRLWVITLQQNWLLLSVEACELVIYFVKWKKLFWDFCSEFPWITRLPCWPIHWVEGHKRNQNYVGSLKIWLILDALIVPRFESGSSNEGNRLDFHPLNGFDSEISSFKFTKRWLSISFCILINFASTYVTQIHKHSGAELKKIESVNAFNAR